MHEVDLKLQSIMVKDLYEQLIVEIVFLFSSWQDLAFIYPVEEEKEMILKKTYPFYYGFRIG